MLVTMKAKTAAARAVCYLTARELDLAERASDEAQRKAALARANLLTPVAKAFSTDLGVEVASDGVQVHGGMGYIGGNGRRAAFFATRASRPFTKAQMAFRRLTLSRANCRWRVARSCADISLR